MSIEELMNIKVTLATRTPVSLSTAASAIQVLTAGDIRRSGASSVPEALRLIPNVQAAQFNSGNWIVGVRGFSTAFANKLLVMIDGRTVYTPLFGGVIWDMQNLLLEDIDRIEVVSGPGASLWGANAVNGVINIVTKKSQDTQGAYIAATAGTFLKSNVEARYGGKLGKHSTYRLYGMRSARTDFEMPDKSKGGDEWHNSQFGFRMDFEPTEKDDISVHGDAYWGLRETVPNHSPFNGQNITANWQRKFSDASDMILSVYYDRYFREDIASQGSDKMNTADVDFQHRLAIGKQQQFLWGMGYRFVHDHADYRNPLVGILPPKKNLDLFNAFVQDEFALSDKWKLTAGTKLLHNVYTGFELQPSVRASYAVKNNQTLWAAISRAVRTPSRFDADYYLPTYPVPPTSISIAGGPNFVSEKLIAWEAGYRIQPSAVSTFSLSAFYNGYDDIYSVEALPGTLTYQIMNGSEAKSWGIELDGAFQFTKNWRVRGGYTYFDKNLQAKDGHTFNPDYLANDVKHRAIVQSIVNLPWDIQFDVAARYMDKIDSTIATDDVPAYFTFDVRVAWETKHFELSVVGQNLAEENHTEFNTLYVLRGVYAKIAARF
jgi:iron complex outermembrane receptor protein